MGDLGDTAKVLVGVAAVKIGDDLEPVGYTSDGVTMTVRSSFAEIKVEELVGSIKRVLTDQTVEVSLNMAEASLQNMANAIPGSELDGAGTKLTIGGGSLQEFKLTLEGKAPNGKTRVITLDKVNPVGDVGIPYKKSDISIVPVTFAALVSDDGIFGTKEDLLLDANLTGLTENLAASLVPAFAVGTYVYALAAAAGESAVALVATLAGGTIKYTYGVEVEKEVASGVAEVISLAEGANEITIDVTKSGYEATQYVITVTRAGA